MNLVAKHAVICVSPCWTVGLFLKHKVSVPSTVGPLISLTHRAECEAGLQACRWKQAGEKCNLKAASLAFLMDAGRTSGCKCVK